MLEQITTQSISKELNSSDKFNVLKMRYSLNRSLDLIKTFSSELPLCIDTLNVIKDTPNIEHLRYLSEMVLLKNGIDLPFKNILDILAKENSKYIVVSPPEPANRENPRKLAISMLSKSSRYTKEESFLILTEILNNQTYKLDDVEKTSVAIFALKNVEPDAYKHFNKLNELLILDNKKDTYIKYFIKQLLSDEVAMEVVANKKLYRKEILKNLSTEITLNKVRALVSQLYEQPDENRKIAFWKIIDTYSTKKYEPDYCEGVGVLKSSSVLKRLEQLNVINDKLIISMYHRVDQEGDLNLLITKLVLKAFGEDMKNGMRRMSKESKELLINAKHMGMPLINVAAELYGRSGLQELLKSRIIDRNAYPAFINFISAHPNADKWKTLGGFEYFKDVLHNILNDDKIPLIFTRDQLSNKALSYFDINPEVLDMMLIETDDLKKALDRTIAVNKLESNDLESAIEIEF